MSSRKNRNVRNNNPLNIRANKIKWNGAVGDDGEFVKFESPELGFRAAYKTLMTYRNKHGLDTIDGIISRWAPDNENHTDGYITYVREKMGIRSDVFMPLERYPELIFWMAEMEGAKGAFTIEQIERGIALA
ncbi:hypothetical protein [Pseudoalteromonas sp. Of7M-16]|uniref:hypothetical protein n=1 Tax=Pseudoalteromonas sp. Of7M-16 TaxID=2917756 RepID=UPI001EF70610|nr:hypothetical protein [Pseudoalteromonas sp. Of7M-16]MCG7546951.1 hypothetical protein [Pseudoalteromonas sp. Of7M-16]